MGNGEINITLSIVEFISITTGVVSIILAGFAIWLGWQSERKSTENYKKTLDVLSQITEKALDTVSSVAVSAVREDRQRLDDIKRRVPQDSEPQVRGVQDAD